MAKTAADIFDAAEADGALPVEETNINGDEVHSLLETGSEINYSRMINLSDEYSKRNPNADFHDLQTQKHFLYCCVKGWNAVQPIDKKTGERKMISWNTARQRYTEWLAAWKRVPGNKRIENSNSIYNHMKTKEFRAMVSDYVRPRHYLTVPHFRILMEHMWTKDWYQYQHRGTMVNDYAIYVFSMYSSARVGEFVESSARHKSGRGLKYKDIKFMVFRNERGEAETAICAERDAKGMTLTPQGRPQHAMYEDMEPLLACAVLPALAIALANDAFEDYHSLEEIFDIPAPRAGIPHALRIKKNMLNAPFFQTFDANGPTGVIEKAMTFSTRTVKLGHRAGFASNITIHCTRREALVLADANGYSDAQRKQFAGHRCDTFLPSYASTISTLDGGANASRKEPRPIVTDIFRGMSLQWFPHMEQSLPAKVQAELAQRDDFAQISNEILDLNEKLKTPTVTDKIEAIYNRRDELYQLKRQLISDELSNWQDTQPRTDRDCDASVADRISHFGRVRRLDPPRDRLASSLFLSVALRSEEGRNALRDMITLYTQTPQVAYRPSLRPRDGRCPVEDCGQDMERLKVTARWGHVFGCYEKFLKKEHGFAELCFQCDEWITDTPAWQKHCEAHFDNIDTLPVQFNQIKYRHTPATIYMCPWHLFDPRLDATKRYKQWRNKQPWKIHIDEHILELKKKHGESEDEGKAIPCPDERCGLRVDSVNILLYHLQDAHCINFFNSFKITRPGGGQSCGMTNADTDSILNGLDNEMNADFINETVDTLSSLCADRAALKPKPEVTAKLEKIEKQRSNSLTEPPSTVFTGAVIVKKPRGRPKKQMGDSHIAATATVLTNETTENRKRGRPKKLCIAAQQFNDKVSTDKVAEKKKRGRPRKQPKSPPVTALLHTSTAEVTTKRKRGRPRKHNFVLSAPLLFPNAIESMETGPKRENRGKLCSSASTTLSPYRTRHHGHDSQPPKAADDSAQCGSTSDREVVDSGSSDYSSDEQYSIFESDSQSESEEETIRLPNAWQKMPGERSGVKRRKRE